MPVFPVTATPVTLVGEADAAVDLAGADPVRAAALGTAIVARARAARDHAAWSSAERARGLAAYHSADVDTAIHHLREAIRHAQRCGSARLAGQARMTLAFAYVSRGQSTRGLREIDAALRDLHGPDRARGLAQRATIRAQLDQLDRALADYAASLRDLRAAGDWIWVWRALCNRAVVHGRLRNLHAAEADLREAASLCEQWHELRERAGFVKQNLGWVATLAGDVPAALGYLDDAEHRLGDLGSNLGEVLCDRAELLLSVYLAAEAQRAAESAVAALDRAHRLNVLPEARLLLARAALLNNNPAFALGQAGRAVREFRRQGRADWHALARLVAITCRRAVRPQAPVRLPELAQVAGTLENARWSAAAVEARVLAGTVAMERGRPSVAREHWARASRLGARGPATIRARAWYASALARAAGGDRRGSASAVRAGIRVVEGYQVAIGATDLRAQAAGHRTELVRLGMRQALESGRPGRVLEWAERSRASLLRLRSVRPPEDPPLRKALTELRVAVSEVDSARRAGRGEARALARQAASERQVRDQFRRRRGDVEATGPVPVARLADSLNDAVLVEFIDHDRCLYAVTLSGKGMRLHRLGDSAAITEPLDRIPFALRLMGRAESATQARAAAAGVLTEAAARLDSALLRPLGPAIGDAALVLVPTGRLQSVPWSILPSCAGRPSVVAPSATAWHQAATAGAHRIGTAAVVAVARPPGARTVLLGAEREAVAVAALHHTRPLTGTAATVEATLRAFRNADLVHVAAHGRLSAENPLFSSLQLADGPLMVYDLEGLDRTPATVVLATCDSGRNVVRAGDELLGLAAAFLAHGTRQLVGSVIPVGDAETAPFMVGLHRRLIGGCTLAEALAGAQSAVHAEGGVALAAAAAFICIGADLPVPPPPVGERAGQPAGLMADVSS
jgi:tetratricopeptide (TPR) repeat protein